MNTAAILIQAVTIQRKNAPLGKRILQSGLIQYTTPDNPRPNDTESLEKDRTLNWTDGELLAAEALAQVKTAIQSSKIFDLPGRILINYCKEDPGTQIWYVEIDEQRTRVVLFDPKPKRSSELDQLIAHLTPFWGT